MIEERPRGLGLKWRTSVHASLMLGGLLALSAAAGCDTVAQLSFDNTTFGAVEVVGLTAPAGSCQGTVDGAATMRFVLLDSQRNTLGPEDRLDSRRVDFNRSRLSVNNAAVFSLPDESCDGMCDGRGLVCDVSDPAYTDSALRRCSRRSDISVTGEPVFRGVRNRQLVFGMLMENTSSFNGRLPASVQSLFPDRDRDGISDNQWSTQSLQESQRATDPSRGRVNMASEVHQTWKSVADRASRIYLTEMFFGMWTFGGVPSSLLSTLPGDTQFVSGRTGTAAQQAVDAAWVTYQGRPTATEEASVYRSIVSIVENDQQFSRPAFMNAEKVLMVFVDGPDELRLPAFNADRVISAAQSRGVKLYIVHLDSAVQQMSPAGEPYFVDIPSYIEPQADSPCGSDADCFDYEECRRTTGYASGFGAPLTLPVGVAPDGLDNTFCHIKRDARGRIGPIADYARIACETQGGYIYIPAPGSQSELGSRVGWLPRVLDGLWEVPVALDVFAAGQVDVGQGYKVQYNVNATVVGATQSRSQAQLGLERGEGDARDTRSVLFSVRP